MTNNFIWIQKFEELRADIEAGLVNCVIVKDLSRLGCNVIETGECIEEYFPQREVRFISVNDEIDTLDGTFNLSDECPTGASFMNVMNEVIVRDIQKKTRFTLDAFAKEGKYIAPRTPYGYRKSSDDKHKLVVDIEAILNREVEAFRTALDSLKQKVVVKDNYSLYSGLNAEAYCNTQTCIDNLNQAIEKHIVGGLKTLSFQASYYVNFTSHAGGREFEFPILDHTPLRVARL